MSGPARCVCGTVWLQRGNRTCHCAACHRTFDSNYAFDAHRKGLSCVEPAGLVRKDGSPRFRPRTGGAQADSGVIYWQATITEAQQARFDRLQDRP